MLLSLGAKGKFLMFSFLRKKKKMRIPEFTCHYFSAERGRKRGRGPGFFEKKNAGERRARRALVILEDESRKREKKEEVHIC